MKLRIVVLGLASCALTRKSPPLDIHYYAPQSSEVAPASEPTEIKIRLGRVFAGSHLRSRIAYRASPIEIEFYETKRWTEPPEAFVQRALERMLIARGVLVTGGKALKLDVEVLGFEEVRSPQVARVSLRYMLIDDRQVVSSGVVEVERPATQGFDSFVTALGAAIDDACERLAEKVL